jgi:oxidase EvaA
MTISAHIPEAVQCRREEVLRQMSDAQPDKGHPASPGATETAVDLVVSRTIEQALHSDDEVDRWIKHRRTSGLLETTIIPLDRAEGWQIDAQTGNIVHVSGKFFSITGVKARHRTNAGELEWDQPIIDQPEIGILGILAMKIGGVLHFCLQAKAEPGTIHAVQLSPTVQATYSNYTGVHGGSLPPFVSYFLDPPKERIVFAKLQTEDGGRFLFKSNRNMIIQVNEGEIQTLPEGFIWLTLRQISRLIRMDNVMNACCRSVLAGLFSGRIPNAVDRPAETKAGKGPQRETGAGWCSEPLSRETIDPRVFADGSWRSYADLVQWIDDMKSGNHMFQQRVPLKLLRDWHFNGNGHLVYRRHRYFTIVGLHITSSGREVASWCQPILDNISTGIIGLLVRRGLNGPEFLMQAKAEVGNRATIQLAPTVQFTQENYLDNEKLSKPFLFNEFLKPGQFTLYAETRQSEEGARFYREEHVHRILMLPEHLDLEVPRDFRWLTADELRFLLNMGEQVNSCARSILACLI